jgi:pimeloyl-ACP methyl ester carboxylesterase
VRRFLILAAAVGTLLGLLGAPPASAALPAVNGGDRAAAPPAAPTSPGASTLAWKKCGGDIQCAALRVPVDYRTPSGQTVDIAVARLPATDPSRRIGSLVVNYGGPGDPGTQTLRAAAKTVPAPVRARFDIVSFDPRGTGASKPIDCIDDATADRLYAEDPTPDTPDDLARFYAGTNSSIDLVKACIDKYGTWLAEVGTRNVARDLERLRIALGDQRLTYLGYSYGTVIGAVYAQMYPRRVRAMVLDSAVDLSDTPQQEELGNAQGFEQALDAFLADCAARTSCRFQSDGDPKAALTHLRDRFENGLRLPTGDGRRAGESTFYLALITALYDKKEGWPALAAGLAAAEQNDGTILQLIADTYTGRDAKGHYDNIQEAIGPIRCADRDDVKESFDSYRTTFEQYAAEFPFLGRLVAGSPIGCDPRLPAVAPGEQVGDVRVTDAPPILIVGTTNDPATPYAGAVDLQQRISRSRLLTFDSTEHGSYAKGIPCIDRNVDRYLLTLKLPPTGTRCKG